MAQRLPLFSRILDIRLWILLFFVVRLVGITNPPLETGHNWRQSLTNMVTRNFVEGYPNILYPAIDNVGNQPGFLGSEFPFFNYVLYLVSLLFGYDHWHGRLFNLLVSSVGMYYFYRLILHISSQRVAFLATIVLLSSIWFAFSRKIMPDTFSVALMIIGLYYGCEYVLRDGKKNLLLYFCFATLGALCKIPAVSLLSIAAIPIFMQEVALKKKIALAFATGFSIILVSAWYFYWVPYLLATYQNQLYFPRSLRDGLLEIAELLPEFSEKFYFSALHSFVALPFLLVGIYTLVKQKNKYLWAGVVLISMVFLYFIIKTGITFPLHNYYIIPFVPLMAFLVGLGLSKLPTQWAYAAVAIIAIEGIINQQHDFFIKDSEKYKLTLEGINQRYINPNELIVINGGQSPQAMYFAHRKGWTVENSKLTPFELRKQINLGAAFLIIDKHLFSEKIDGFPIVYQDENYSIYKLKAQK